MFIKIDKKSLEGVCMLMFRNDDMRFMRLLIYL